MNRRAVARSMLAIGLAWMVGLILGLAGRCVPASGAEEVGPFALWLTNNEAETLRLLARDRALIDHLQGPLAVLPDLPTRLAPRPELELLERHRKMVGFLLEAVRISEQAGAIVEGRGIEKLNNALTAARDRLGQASFRQLIQLLEDFAALYPSERQVRNFLAVLPSGFSPDSPPLGAGRGRVATAAVAVGGGRATGSPGAGTSRSADQVFRLFGEGAAGGRGSGPAAATGAAPASGTASGTGDEDGDGADDGAEPAGGASGTAAPPAANPDAPAAGSPAAVDPASGTAEPASGTAGAGPEDDPFNVLGK